MLHNAVIHAVIAETCLILKILEHFFRITHRTLCRDYVVYQTVYILVEPLLELTAQSATDLLDNTELLPNIRLLLLLIVSTVLLKPHLLAFC